MPHFAELWEVYKLLFSETYMAPVADPEKFLGGAEKHATTTCSSIKTPHKREI